MRQTLKNLNPINYISLWLVFLINMMLMLGMQNLIKAQYAYVIVILWTLFTIIYISTRPTPNIKHFYSSLSKFEKILLFFVIIIIITTLIRCFAPISGMDVLTARLNAPKRYIQNGGFLNLPHVLASNFPMGVEMLYMFSMLMFPDISANFVAFGISLLVIYLVYILTLDYFDKRIAFLAVIMVLSTQIFYVQSWSPLEDMALAYFSLLSLWALTKFYKNQTLQNLIIFSIYAGTTVVVKYNGTIFIALLYMTLFALMLKEKKIKYYFLSVLISLTMFLPWAYKAYLYTGDPFYPFLINLFHITEPYNHDKFYELGATQYSFWQNLLYLFTNIINNTIIPIKFNDYYSSLNGLASPLIFLLLLIAILKRFWENIQFRILILLSAINYLLHFILMNSINGPPPRYYFVSYILLSIIGAWGYYQIEGKILKRLVDTTIVAWLVIFTLHTTYKKMKTYPYIFGYESAAHYHANSAYGFPYHSSFIFMNEKVAPGDKVLLFDPRGYYLDASYVSSKNVFNALKSNDEYNPDAYYAYLSRNNVKYIWYDQDKKDQTHPTYYLIMDLTKDIIAKYHWKEIYHDDISNCYIFVDSTRL